MVTGKISQFAKQNPVVTGVGTLAVAFFAYRLVSKILNREQIPEKPPLPPIPPTERKYSYPSEQYLEWADALQKAFDGAFTDNDRVKSIMSYMKTKGDVLALINAYGRRVISTPYFIDSDAMTLSQTITDEMSVKDIDKYVNVPLSRTGFKF